MTSAADIFPSRVIPCKMATEEKLVELLRAGDKFAKAEDCRHDRCNCAIMDEAADTISRLVGERDAILEIASDLRKRHPLRWKFDMADAANASATAAEARVAQLEMALKPFAEAADSIDDSEGDRIEMWEHPASMQVTAADFRRARTALSQSPDRESGT